jgi:hypothetical protein
MNRPYHASPQLERLYGEDGYFRGITFSDVELATMRAIIRKKWLQNLSRLDPRNIDLFGATATDQYHRIAHLIDHQRAWIKDSRIFNRNEVEEILALPFFRALEEYVGPFEVADIEGLGHPEIYWRLVRPDEAGDVAGAHADAWFYEYTNELTQEQQKGLVKVWVAMHVEPGKSGLSVLPGSHKVEWPNRSELRHGRKKPVLGVPQETLALVTLDTAPGEAVVFNTRLLHAGVAHTGGHSRISIEFAIRLLS